MVDAAHDWTEDEIKKLEERIAKAYSDAYAEAVNLNQDFLKDFDKKLKEWRETVKKDPGKQKAFKSWLNEQLFKREFRHDLVEQLARDLVETERSAAAIINDELPVIFAQNANYVMYTIENQAKMAINFTLVDQDTVRVLLRDQPDVLPLVSPDGKKAMKWNTEKVRNAVTQSILLGEPINDMAKRLRGVYKMGEKMSVMAARTSATGAENAGRVNSYKRAERMGIEMLQEWVATLDDRTRDSHRMLDGEQIEVGTKFSNGCRFPGDPHGSPEEVYNCFIGETNVAVNSEILRSFRHSYDGELVTVKTAAGVQFTCTPNHPILTRYGWIAAKKLHEGDNLIVTRPRNKVFSRRYPNINHVFTSFNAIHNLFKRMGGKRTSTLMVDFHGDIPASEVEVIAQEWFLRSNINTRIRKFINKFLFKSTDESFFTQSSFMKHFRRVATSAFCGMGFFRESLSFFWCGLRHPEVHRLRPIALLYPGRIKALNNDISGDIELLSKCLNGFTGIIFLDNIVAVDRCSRSTHVYNLQTENGYYFVKEIIQNKKRKDNGIAVFAHNCRCTLVAALKGVDLSDAKRHADFKEGQTYEEWKKGKGLS